MGDKLSWKRKLAALAVLTGSVTGIMHTVNKLVYYISTVDNLLDYNKYNYYEWRFGKIAYKKQGTGTPILLIHDLNVGSSSYEWNNIVNHLSKTNTVYTIDLLGCGCSDKPNFTYTNFLYVQMISDFIKHIIGSKTDIIVSGESGSFVLMACSNDPSIINRVILVNPESLVSLAKVPTKRTKLMKYLICTPILGTFIYNIAVNKKTISQDFYSSYYYNQNLIDEKSIITYFESSHKKNTRSKYLYASQKSRFTNLNILYCLHKLNNSIFIITGNSNPENGLIANQYQNQLPSIEIIGINKTKHLPHMERPEEFIEQVKILFSEEN